MKNTIKLAVLFGLLSFGFMACETDTTGDVITPGNDTSNCYADPTCTEGPQDGNCDLTCMYDPDCKNLSEDDLVALGFDGGSTGNKCDWNGDNGNTTICEPAYKCTTVGLTSADLFTYNNQTVVRPCPNDPQCTGGVFPCKQDGHCDKWCPCNLDPDCAGMSPGTDCCPNLSCVQ